MKSLFKKSFLMLAISLIAFTASSQIINLTVTQYDNNTIASLTQGFNVAKIGRVITDGSGASFYYNDNKGKHYVLVSETVAQVAAITGSVDAIPQSLAKRVVLKFDATGGKTVGTYNLTQLNGEAFTLPINARVLSADYEVQTTFQSATDAAEIGLGIASDDVVGLLTPIAISLGTPFDLGVHDGNINHQASTYSEKTTTSTRTIDAVVSVESLTAGILVVILEYAVLA